LARLQCTRQSMFLACARVVAARHPEKFGRLKSMAAYHQQIEKAKADLEAAKEAVALGWSAEDVDCAGEPVFKALPGVRVGGSDLGHRLASGWSEVRAQRRAA
jgi:hypothetical protein